MLVRVLRFEAVAVQPSLPLMGGVLGFDSHCNPIWAVDGKIHVPVVIACLNRTAQHFENADNLSDLLAIVQMSPFVLEQTIADGGHFRVCCRISDDRLQP